MFGYRTLRRGLDYRYNLRVMGIQMGTEPQRLDKIAKRKGKIRRQPRTKP